MLKKLIIIEGSEQIQCNTLEDIVKILIDENYYNMTEDGKENKRKLKALANCLGQKKTVVKDIDKEVFEKIDELFIIKDEITYILSLLMTNKIILLERKDANIFAKELNKKNITENYILINTFAKELLINYIK